MEVRLESSAVPLLYLDTNPAAVNSAATGVIRFSGKGR